AAEHTHDSKSKAEQPRRENQLSPCPRSTILAGNQTFQQKVHRFSPPPQNQCNGSVYNHSKYSGDQQKEQRYTDYFRPIQRSAAAIRHRAFFLSFGSFRALFFFPYVLKLAGDVLLWLFSHFVPKIGKGIR